MLHHMHVRVRYDNGDTNDYHAIAYSIDDARDLITDSLKPMNTEVENFYLRQVGVSEPDSHPDNQRRARSGEVRSLELIAREEG